MALDKLTIINNGGLSTTSDYRVGVLTATKFVGPIEGAITSADATFTGNVSIGGTLTYEDVTNIDSVGLITARDGIFIPDNKELKFGNTAASSDFRIYHNGSTNVLAGFTASDINIESYFGADVNIITNSNHYAIKCLSNAGTELYWDNELRLTTTDDGITVDKGVTINGIEGGDAQIRLRADQGDDNNDMFRFVVSDGDDALKIQNYDGSFNDKLAVTSTGARVTGSLGVGISPSRNFHVNSGAINACARFESTDTEVALEFKDTTGTASLKCRDDFRFNSSTGEKLRIESDGKVGIGTDNPSQKLTVRGTILKTRTDSGLGLIYLQNDASNNGQVVINQNAGVTRVKLDSAGVSYFNGGNVGIGSLIPSAKLDIIESTSNAAVKIKSGTNTNQNASLTFSNDNGGGLLHLGVFGSSATTFGSNEATDAFITANNQLSINAQNNSGEIRFGIGSTPNTKLRIKSDGNIHQVWDNGLFFGAYYSSEYYMGFTYGTNARELYIDNRSNDTRADIVFRTKEGGAPVQRFRIASDGTPTFYSPAVAWHEGPAVLEASNGYAAIFFRSTGNTHSTSTAGTWSVGKLAGSDGFAILKKDITGSSGTTRGDAALQITNTGNTIIGKSLGVGVSPASGYLLTLKDSSADAKVIIESESGYDARLVLDTSNGGGAGAHIDFQVDGTLKGGIQYVSNASASDTHDIVFRNTSNSEKLRIKSGGEVGISPGGISPTSGDMGTGSSQNTPLIHVKGSGTSATGGKYNLLARFEAGGDADETGAMIVLNHSNDRGLAIEGGRRTGNYAHGALKIIDNIGRVSEAMLIHGGAGQGVDHISFATGISTITTRRLLIDNQGNIKTGTIGSALNFTDSNSGNTKSIEIGANNGGDALFVAHASGYGVGYFGYEAGGDRLVIACDGGGNNNKIDFITDAGTSTGGGTDNLNGKNPKMRILANGNVGISKNTPLYMLDIEKPNSNGSSKQLIQRWMQNGQNTLEFHMYGGSADLNQFAAVNGEQNLSFLTGVDSANVDSTETTLLMTRYRDLWNQGPSSGTRGGGLFIGRSADPSGNLCALRDNNRRPVVYVAGKYPEINLVHEVPTNTSHGGTIRFATYIQSTNTATGKQFVIGPNGSATFLDIGYADAGQNVNVHNGINNHSGTTLFRVDSANNTVKIAGHIIQVGYARYDPNQDTYTSINQDTKARSAAYLDFTPKYANSKLLIMTRMHTRMIAANGCSYGIDESTDSGSSWSVVSGMAQRNALDFFYKGDSVNHHYTGFCLIQVDASNTSSRRYSPWGQGWGGGTWEISYGHGEHSVTVYEIATTI